MAASKLTITMTDRPPVEIDRDLWPIIASAAGKEQGEGGRSWYVKVRQHADGRIIVHGHYSSPWEDESDKRAGELLGEPRFAPLDTADLVAAIKRVAEAIGCPSIAQKCIATLPVEKV